MSTIDDITAYDILNALKALKNGADAEERRQINAASDRLGAPGLENDKAFVIKGIREQWRNYRNDLWTFESRLTDIIMGFHNAALTPPASVPEAPGEPLRGQPDLELSGGGALAAGLGVGMSPQ